jgi:hypothetical protein
VAQPRSERRQARYLLGVDWVAKVFLEVEQKVIEPLMHFARGDVRDHID